MPCSSMTIESTEPIHIEIPDNAQDPNLSAPQRVINFVNSIYDILVTLELPGFKKMFQTRLKLVRHVCKSIENNLFII